MNKVVARFAPSPTGHLHLGGARTAIFNWLLARHYGGKFILRIEDTDIVRSKQEYTDSILSSMRWLGLDWDGELVYQTQRMDVYRDYVNKLLSSGHAYWCSCTPEEVDKMREDARALGQKPRYNGHCRDKNLGPGEGHCVRLRIPASGKIVFDDMVKGSIATDISELDDMVIQRADGTPTYNMAVVVDDHEMGVTHVLRGDDHISNTPRQILIYEALGLQLPKFGHVPMILGPDRKKLSKRHGARAVIEYEQDGLLPQALVNYLARLGWSHGDQEIFTKDELIEFFNGKNLNPASAAFDPKKLEWCNSQFMRKMPLNELSRQVVPFVKKNDLWKYLGDDSGEKLAALCAMYRERCNNLEEMAIAFKPLLVPVAELTYNEKDKKKLLESEHKEDFGKFIEVINALSPFNSQTIEDALNNFVKTNNLKFKNFAPLVRISLMGFMGGSHLNEIMAFLGKDETVERLRKGYGLCSDLAQFSNSSPTS